MARTRILVANGNEDVLAALGDALTEAGYEVLTVHVRPLRLGQLNFRELFRSFRPRLALVDIGPPYQENWAFARTLLDEPATGDIPFVWTTTNARALKELTGAVAEEILLKPFDLDQLLRKVRAQLEAGAAREPGHPSP